MNKRSWPISTRKIRSRQSIRSWLKFSNNRSMRNVWGKKMMWGQTSPTCITWSSRPRPATWRDKLLRPIDAKSSKTTSCSCAIKCSKGSQVAQSLLLPQVLLQVRSKAHHHHHHREIERSTSLGDWWTQTRLAWIVHYFKRSQELNVVKRLLINWLQRCRIRFETYVVTCVSRVRLDDKSDPSSLSLSFNKHLWIFRNSSQRMTQLTWISI